MTLNQWVIGSNPIWRIFLLDTIELTQIIFISNQINLSNDHGGMLLLI